MTKNNGFKVAALAASMALATAATSAMADPATNALPGQGKVTAGAAVATMGGTAAAPTMGIAVTGNTVINWGQGTTSSDINNTGTAGFNIGSAAAVNLTGTGGVLNIDSSGNPSQIFGQLTGAGNVFVANGNGIVVGESAQISGSGEVGLIANTLGTIAFDGTAADTSIEFNGTGGNVSVAKGARINGASVLVSGGGTVNVDLSAFTGGNATIQAGVKNSASGTANDNTGATLTSTGDLGGATLAGFASAGNASVTGTTLALGSNARVDGTLTNTGDLTLGSGFAIGGGLVNNGTVTQADDVSMGRLINNKIYAGGSHALTATAGGISNGGSMTGLGAVTISNGGDVVNGGTFDAGTNNVLVMGGGNVTNNGSFAADVSINQGGNFSNTGDMTGSVGVVNGSITNSGQLTTGSLETASSMATGNGFAAGGQYSINNTGTITAFGLYLIANSEGWGLRDPAASNDSIGSISNTGVLRLSAGSSLTLYAHNGVNLAGTLQIGTGGVYGAPSVTNALDRLNIYANDYNDTSHTASVATVATDIVVRSGGTIVGSQVRLMSNFSTVDATGKPFGSLGVVARAKSDSDYTVRVAAGKTITAHTILVNGEQAGDEPNVILQGTLAAQYITFGGSNAVSDVFAGPTGSLSLFKIDADPWLWFHFTGAVKTAKYNNASNFRFNGLNVVTDGSPFLLNLDPTKYTTNGTSNGLSAVNILVQGDVTLKTPLITAYVPANGTAATGATDIPNTHLVLQSSGNISTDGNFYWPGYVYLGNVAADANGNAQPGTLGPGTIALGGDFNNVLPGDIAGASGIHLITQSPLDLGGHTIVTNANAWVNFGSAQMTEKYASEQDATTGPFFGGKQGSNSMVNYGVLDASAFVTQVPDANK